MWILSKPLMNGRGSLLRRYSVERAVERAAELKHFNKSLLADTASCLRLGWLNRRYNKRGNFTTFEQFLATQGDRFEEYVVKRMFPNDTINGNDTDNNRDADTVADTVRTIDSRDGSEGHRKTLELLSDASVSTVLQPTFHHPPYTARGDVLHRSEQDGPWTLYEMKSSTSSSVSRKVPDLAFTYNLAKKSVPNLGDAMLVTVRSGKEEGEGGKKLFQVHNLTSLVREEIERLEDPPPSLTSLEYLESVTSSPDPPPPVPQPKCGNCDYFTSSCFPEVKGKNSIWEYKRLGTKKFSKMAESSFLATDADVRMLSDTHLKHLKSITSGSPVVDLGLGKALGSITKDCFYLDFEAVNPLFPLDGSEGGKPYEQQVTQYSLHYVKRADVGHGVGSGGGSSTGSGTDYAVIRIKEEDSEHSEFLIRDVSEYEDLVDSLIEKLGEGTESIIVYSSYERTSLNRFAKAFPRKREAISRIIRRLVDLEKIVKLVHLRGFVGRTSIKTVLPALDPTYNDAYEKLKQTSGIGDGGDASAAMCDLIEGRVAGKQEAEDLRRALLEYCRLDSWAMVVVHLEIERIWNAHCSKMDREVGREGRAGAGASKGEVNGFGPGVGDGLELLTVEALKALLREKGLKLGGRKLELIKRLRE
ncbi:hypothetical protein TrST_g2394 [Triparma strigata]|uniref:SAP domain-containing protein n=1 Tax=Triparma strigata TaxID=1606541 RepID=A0A9W7AJD9_9STRA|nr:hypothetical protein TrST_g2394 [Triparma strigata]